MFDEVFEKLSKSKFRSKFKLKEKDLLYIKEKGLKKKKTHKKESNKKKRAQKVIPNDEKTPPRRGHTVLTAQNETAACCRSCIFKWHKFKKDVELNENQKEYLVLLITEWIKRQL